VIAVVKEHSGAYGQGAEYAATMVHKTPATRFREEFASPICSLVQES